MTALIPVVHNTTSNTHEPIAAADTLSLLPAQATALTAVLDLGTDSIKGVLQLATPAEAAAGINTTKAITAAGLAAAIAATDVNIASLAFNAATGVLTITETDATVHTITITDVEVGTTTAPATTTASPIPTTYYGTNAARLGDPDGWFLINGKRVPYFN